MNGTAPALHCFVFQSEPCQNGGRCIVTWNDFHCSCPANFTGKFCEERVWCESDPCPEATTCVDVLAVYVCKYCSPVYMLVKIVFLLAKCLQSVFLVRTVAINTNTCCNNSAAISKLGMMPKYALLQAACILWIYYHFVLEQRLYSKVYFFFFLSPWLYQGGASSLLLLPYHHCNARAILFSVMFLPFKRLSCLTK